jgi:response regulator RpfG family c-di-GMP phosphodiesterase
MRKEEKFRNIPILMLTGMRNQTGFFFLKDDPRDNYFLPVDEFVEKPINPQDLLDRVEKILIEKEKKCLSSQL